MISLLKDILRPVKTYINCIEFREFHRLQSKWSRIPRHVEINDVNFLEYRFDVPDMPSFINQFREIFYDKIYKFDTTEEEPVIIDCGANIGMSLLYFKSIFPQAKIKAYEADYNIFNILKNNLLKNEINDISVENKAVWVNNDGVVFSSDNADGGAIIDSKEDESNKKIESIRLKEVLDYYDNISFLKIDIEGAEFEVLNDCRDSLSKVDNLFVECHCKNNKKQEISSVVDVLESNGFRYYIEGLHKRTSPFINKSNETIFDLQLNVFAYRR